MGYIVFIAVLLQGKTLIDSFRCTVSSLYRHPCTSDYSLSDHSLISAWQKRGQPQRHKKKISIRSRCNGRCLLWGPTLQTFTGPQQSVPILAIVIQIHFSLKKIQTQIEVALLITSEFLSLLDTRKYTAREFSRKIHPLS